MQSTTGAVKGRGQAEQAPLRTGWTHRRKHFVHRDCCGQWVSLGWIGQALTLAVHPRALALQCQPALLMCSFNLA